MGERFEVKYRGFVYIDQPSGGLPDRKSMEKAAKLLKSHKKTAQNIHPLFARGLDTKLNLEVTTGGIKVTVPKKDGPCPIVMNQPMHKIAYVVDIGTCTCFIVQRPGKGKYKCHSFETGSSKTAHELAFEAANMCNQVFKKVRQSVRRLRKTTKKLGVDLDAKTTKDLSAISQLAQQSEETASQFKDAVQDAAAEDGDSSNRGDTNDNDDDDDNVDDDDEHMAVGPEVVEPEWDESGEYLTVDFIDGMSDQLAEMLVGPAAHDDGLDWVDDFSLDNDMFLFGEVVGEAVC
ncbi:hypothetical protein PTSG_05870 [Salpingoeca rosetta]|uniref:PID domain-containing protein n=1 Tax=Salpingoeca rosetta (strain ATCC 50818 / BSB-021) TaxID=946362 RepID=F2UD11_SALR5|nr:uncharacterized protein PTSG_05870 [Salpingoeca rosetta]EGD74506.1 hypothetical protein PTSG_05870 [Salpingoeca rosetta]|eukprot:XP_004992763.1 hypothetical protein PTSG_05870 [Salpingoeca rosetta]